MHKHISHAFLHTLIEGRDSEYHHVYTCLQVPAAAAAGGIEPAVLLELLRYLAVTGAAAGDGWGTADSLPEQVTRVFSTVTPPNNFAAGGAAPPCGGARRAAVPETTILTTMLSAAAAVFRL